MEKKICTVGKKIIVVAIYRENLVRCKMGRHN